MQWTINGVVARFPADAVIQTGMSRELIQSMLEEYGVTTIPKGYTILEYEFDHAVGSDPVVEVPPGWEVRYALDPGNKGGRDRQRKIPYIFLPRTIPTNYVTVCVNRPNPDGGELQIMRAHLGSAYPPVTFTKTSKRWPGRIPTSSPGREGCREFWQACAMVTTDFEWFNSMTTHRPGWLTGEH